MRIHYVLGVITAIGLSVQQPAGAAILHVDAQLVTGNDDGSQWDHAFQGRLGLQAALATAQAGDVIWVAEGVYAPAPAAGDRSLSFEIPTGVSVLGGFVNGGDEAGRDPAAHVTVLTGDLNDDDGPIEEFGIATNTIENSRHVVQIVDGDNSTLLDGFTVRSGHADGSIVFRWDQSGGNIRIESGAPVLLDLVVELGRAVWSGGGLAARECAPTIEGCLFRTNRADQLGSGMALLENTVAQLVDCEVAENYVAFGGIYLGPIDRFGGPGIGADVTSIDCTFRDSFCIISGSSGGGIAAIDSSIQAHGCRFLDNECTGGGGGAFIRTTEAWFDRCDFVNNAGTGDGGGALFIDGMTGNEGRPVPLTRVTNSRFVGNNGVAVISGRLALTGSTMANNSIGKPFLIWPVLFGGPPSEVTVENSIIWDNGSSDLFPQPGGMLVGDATYLVDQSIIEGWDGSLPGDAQNVDPMFVDSAGADAIPGTVDDDVRLSPGSPGIDTGDNGLVDADTPLDFEGRSRISDGDSDGTATVDLGAFEFGGEVAVPALGTWGMAWLIVVQMAAATLILRRRRMDRA